MIKTLIIDWGGVLTTGRYTPAILKVLSKKRQIHIDKIYPEFDSYIIQMNEGSLTYAEFFETVNKKFNLKITEEQQDRAPQTKRIWTWLPHTFLVSAVQKSFSKFHSTCVFSEAQRRAKVVLLTPGNRRWSKLNLANFSPTLPKSDAANRAPLLFGLVQPQTVVRISLKPD